MAVADDIERYNAMNLFHATVDVSIMQIQWRSNYGGPESKPEKEWHIFVPVLDCCSHHCLPLHQAPLILQ